MNSNSYVRMSSAGRRQELLKSAVTNRFIDSLRRVSNFNI
jgi:hypothetical protein